MTVHPEYWLEIFSDDVTFVYSVKAFFGPDAGPFFATIASWFVPESPDIEQIIST